LKLPEQAFFNLFFGVRPRLGADGRFDLAWQIRTVRTLWTDIDHVTVDEAIDRVAEAGLSEPSIIVNSGNGVHLYWLLDEPFHIDDVGRPPPIETEWNDAQQRRRYYEDAGWRIYLDDRRESPLSERAKHLQNLLICVADAVGGDHTTDLSRLLRLPGSLNRKDQRNGKAPVACSLVRCDPGRKFTLSSFEQFEAARFDTRQQADVVKSQPSTAIDNHRFSIRQVG